MHYEVEIRTAAGGWLEVERARREGGEPRVVQAADDGTRKVME